MRHFIHTKVTLDMSLPASQEEPLRNIDLESAILGLRMALTSEEEVGARKKFLDQLTRSTLVLPTVKAVPTQPDGSIMPGADITFVVVEARTGGTGVPGFTTLAGLRAAFPNVNNGVFLNGAQAAAILASSPHRLFVNGPDMHTEVELAEMAAIAAQVSEQVARQQEEANHNGRLEAALADWTALPNDRHREALTNAFLTGFCRIPVAADVDKGAKVVMLQTKNGPDGLQAIPLLTESEHLLCFTSQNALLCWERSNRSMQLGSVPPSQMQSSFDDEQSATTVPRSVADSAVQHSAVALPGAMIVDMAARAHVPAIGVNVGSNASVSLRVENNRLIIV